MAGRRVALMALVAALAAEQPALADDDRVVLLPTTARTVPVPPSRQRHDVEAENLRLQGTARELDLVLSEAVQDLGLTLDLAARPRTSAAPSDEELVATAAAAWVIAPEIAFDRGDVLVRIVAVPPGSKVVLSRRERVDEASLEVATMHLLREVVDLGRGAAPPTAEAAPGPAQPVERMRSSGRAVLALHGAALGGYAGYSVQRASGSDDVRLTYPLTALGAGVGLGATMIAADEWDVGVGDAWFLASGVDWPGAGGLLLARGYAVEPLGDRYLYGLLGASGGLTLATFGAAFGHVDAGGAALAHSGGLFGTFLGGLLQAGIAGSTAEPLYLGLGYGAIGGVIVAGVAGTQFGGSSSRVLFVDLVAGLGGLSGAALASPLMVGDEQSAGETRWWLASIAAGTAAGAAIGTLATRPRAARPHPNRAAIATLMPYGGVIAEGSRADAPPFLGAGLEGTF